MQDVMVSGKGQRAQELLNVMESTTEGLRRPGAVRDGATLERVYRVDAPSREAAVSRIREALGKEADGFTIG